MAFRDDDDDEEEVAEEVEEEQEEEEEEEEEERPSRKRKKHKAAAYIDDVAEEDDDEEEEEEPSRRKRRVRSASEFIDDAAIDASDEEEEEEEEEEGFLDDGGADLPEEEGPTSRRPHRNLLPDDQPEDVDYMEKLIKERYGGGQDYSEYEEAETPEVEQQALLPSVKDPKLWMVRCQVGHEREAVVCLMQKYLDLEHQGQPLAIKSAVALDHLKGMFYVESEREAYVRQAIKGMRMIFQSKVTLVPIKEMADVLSVQKKTIDIANESWVRIKNGLYKGDLAKVVDVDHVKQRVRVMLIPRLDLQALAAKLQDDRDDRDKKKTLRPAPRFLNVEELKDMRIPVDRRRDGATGELLDVFSGMTFKDGYLYKMVSLKSVDSDVVPTFDELQKFQKPGEDGSIDAMGLPSAVSSKQRAKLMKGDAVVIIEGDLQNLMGTVEKVDEALVYIRPKDLSLKETIAVNEAQVRKFFKTGDHVKVIRGAHLGSTGMVVKVNLHSVVLLNDTTKEDIQVFTADVVESSEVTTGLSKLGDYELHDLVLLDQATVGVIIRVEPDGCQILKGNTEKPEVITVKQRDMRKKIFDRKAYAADGDGNMISLKDIVRVRDGRYKGRQGPVEHINRGVLFVSDRHHLENGGFFCVRSQACVALGGTRSGNERVTAVTSSFSELHPPSQYLQSPRRTPVRDVYQPHTGFGGGYGGRNGGHARRDEGLVGRTVKIRLGPFKGHRGRVKDATSTTVRVELESQMKDVTVRRDHLSDIGDMPMASSSFRVSPRYGLGSETPMHPSRTPMHPGSFMTPMRDPSATPIHEGMRTPMRDRAWNPHAQMTPLRDNSWDDSNPSTWNASTPQYQPGTPGGQPYEAATPGASWVSTPGLSYSEATPEGSVSSYGNAPSPYISGPGGPPMTPGAPTFLLPGTPGQPMTPGTGSLEPLSPASGVSSSSSESKWGLPDVIVTVRAHGIGVIREVLTDGNCTVALGMAGAGETIIASHTEMELVLPKKSDKVKMVLGEHRGATGKLIGIDGADGIVKMDETLDIQILNMGNIGKMSAT